ncbi:hypothetical protein ACJIZ3_004980 [Penstemon smallii]|uniref:Uncharacterized protein n=1 Tax=Penstemon smallii TaxID=265156 RepID=A0ABD3S3M7_9LAMI
MVKKNETRSKKLRKRIYAAEDDIDNDDDDDDELASQKKKKKKKDCVCMIKEKGRSWSSISGNVMQRRS